MEKLKKIDKRSVRTRSQIRKAVIILLKTKRPDEIRVCEITSLALISRNSFYTHYNSVADVLNDIFNETIYQFDLILNCYSYEEIVENPYNLLKETAMLLIDNSAFSEHVIFSKNSNLFVQGIIDALTDRINNIYLKTRGEENFTTTSYLINFLVSGTVEFLYKWFKDGKPVPFEDLLSQISILVKEGIKMIRGVKNTIIKA